jgi:hypothetical protein
MHTRLWSPRAMVGIGFLMLLLTSLQGWGMVGVIAFWTQNVPELLPELKRLHNLGLSGGFLAISSGLTLIVLAPEPGRASTICRVLLPSFLIAPIAFCDRLLVIFAGAIPLAVQAFFYALQAASALGITLGLGLIVLSLLGPYASSAIASR